MKRGVDRSLAAIAELALDEDDVGFRRGLLDILDRAVGFDKASMHIQQPGEAHLTYGCGWEDLERFRDLPHYMSELSPAEIAVASQGRPMVDLDVLPAERRDRLALYAELLRPEKIGTFMTVMWRDCSGIAGVTLARTGRAARFSLHEREAFERLLPTIRVAEGFVRSRQPKSPTPLDAWANHTRLTARERRVAELVVRGLANGEVAEVLGVSTNTVRNQLAAVFRKADVSTRAELVFVASTFVSTMSLDAWTRHMG